MPRNSRTSWSIIVTCAVLCAGGLALFAELLAGALGGQTALGGFLLRGLSWAAFVLPAYLWVGALILAMPGFRTDLLAAMLASLAPFASLAITARFLDEPEAWFRAYPGLRGVGAAGLAGLGFGLTIVMGAALALLVRRAGATVETPDAERPATFARPDTSDTEPYDLDLSLPQLPPVPFLASIQRPAADQPAASPVVAGTAADQDVGTTDTDTAGDPGEAAELEEILEQVDETTAGPAAAEMPPAAVEQPLPLMFNRPHEADPGFPSGPATTGLSGTDPAMDGDYWADAEDDEDPALEATEPEGRRSSLLPKVEVFQDGEHTDAVRPALRPAARHTSPASVASELELSARPTGRRRVPARPALQYSLPTEGILTDYPDGQYWIIDDKTRHAADVLRETLKEFGIAAEVTGIRKGPVITMFEILPAPGVRLSKIANLSDNIALRLAASSVRIVAPIPGKHAVGIEVPNERRSIVSFKEIVESEVFRNAKMEVPVVLGKDITGDVQVVELTQTPHLLIAGATGSGKSVCVNSIILSILYKRSFNEVKLILIDPKIVELKLYNGIPHLLTPVITEPKRAFQALQYCICEMERRYSLLDAMGVRDIRSFNRKIAEKNMATDRLPYIVVVIDEFADLMATTGKELESTLARLAAMSRAVGIHLVLATQRPSIDVITGLIKANIPSRIAFMVASKFDSRIIIDMVGAEKLLGRGDMLYSSATDAFPVRMQGAFVSEDEVERVVAHVKTLGEPDYIDDEMFVDDEEDEGPSLFDDEDDDPLYEKALEIVLSQGKASASFLQRKLKIGYNRAARLVELMEEKGIVGKAQGSKPRDLVHNPELGGMRPPNPRARYVPDPGSDDSEADEVEDAEPVAETDA